MQIFYVFWLKISLLLWQVTLSENDENGEEKKKNKNDFVEENKK